MKSSWHGSKSTTSRKNPKSPVRETPGSSSRTALRDDAQTRGWNTEVAGTPASSPASPTTSIDLPSPTCPPQPLDDTPQGRLMEIFFSIAQRKVLSPNDFDDLEVVVERLAAFETRYNQAAKPFKWKFTTTDLADFLDRLDRHRPAITTDPAQPRAAW